jgi:hypothetical protein
MTLDVYTRAQLARFAIEEGERYGGISNMLGIAHLLRNRVMAGWGDWTEVVQRAPEKRANVHTPPIPNLRTGNVRSFLARIDDIYTRVDVTDLTGGALFYVDPGRTIAEWFRSEVMERPDDHPRSAHIGPVWFYK